MEDEEIVLVSQPARHTFAYVLLSLLLLSACVFLTAYALIAVSWWMEMMSLLIIAGFFSALGFLKPKLYYFGRHRIIIADHRNEYLDETKFEDIQIWNHFETYGKNANKTILIKSDYLDIKIQKSSYTNYEEILHFLSHKNLARDTNFEPDWLSGNVSNQPFSNFEEKSLKMTLISAIISLVFFVSVTHQKKASGESQYFTGKIADLTVSKKYHDTTIRLEEYPAMLFRINRNGKVFEQYLYHGNGNREYTHLGKTVRLQVSKDEFDWKFKNELIKRIHLLSDPEVAVISFEMTNP